MWIEEVTLENIKCFDSETIRLGSKDSPYPWVTFIGENGTGKSSVLQAIGLLLSGPEGANQLLKPEGWLRDETRSGRIGANIHQGPNDPGQYGGDKKERKNFQFSYYITGMEPIRVNNAEYLEPLIIPDPKSRTISWLRSNAFQPKGIGWFGAGYGAFRRLTRANRILVPALQTPLRHTNYISQFKEDQPLEAFESWMVYLDYQISKSNSKLATKQLEWGKAAFDSLLPDGNSFKRVDTNGHIWFDTPQGEVRSVALSDGFRSVLALAGDLIWRLIEAFPESENPLEEQGVVLIDELDIHLHPTWQRSIAGLLRKTFPKIQFIMATHSPLVAAGAGSDAKTFKFTHNGSITTISKVDNIYAKSVDEILKSSAFGLVSEYSIETQNQLDTYLRLKDKRNRTKKEENQFQMTIPFAREALGPNLESSIFEQKLDEFLKSKLK